MLMTDLGILDNCIGFIIHYSILTPPPRYEVLSISFQTFFVQAFKIVVDSWKFTILLLYILSDD